MSDVIENNSPFRSSEIYESYVGRVMRVKQQAGENTDNLRLYVDIELGIGGNLEDVPYYGGGVDIVTGFPHGLFVPPREHQQILILFLRGNSQNPVGCCPLPYPSWKAGAVDKAKYNNIMTDTDNIALFHYSGTRIYLRKNGTIELTKKIVATEYKLSISFDSVNDTFTIEDLQTSNKIILNDSGIQINGKNATSGVIKAAARKDDEVTVAISAAQIASLGLTAGGAPVIVGPPNTISPTGTITKASNEVKISGASV